MKITRSALKNLIKEEMNRINEGPTRMPAMHIQGTVPAVEAAIEASIRPEDPASAILTRSEIRDAWSRHGGVDRSRPDSEEFKCSRCR